MPSSSLRLLELVLEIGELGGTREGNLESIYEYQVYDPLLDKWTQQECRQVGLLPYSDLGGCIFRSTLDELVTKQDGKWKNQHWLYYCRNNKQAALSNVPVNTVNAECWVLEEKKQAIVRRRRSDRKRLDIDWLEEYFNVSSLQGIGDIDFPICPKCSDEILRRLKRSIHEWGQQRVTYENALKNEDVDDDSVNSRKQLEMEVADIEKQIQDVQGQLQQTLDKREHQKISALKIEGLREKTLCHASNSMQMINLAREECKSVELHYKRASAMAERLGKYRVSNDVFHIWHDGPFGTINGFRLGSMPETPIEWVEINAGLGLTALLISTLASTAKFDFQNIELQPYGSFSKIVNAEGKLYSLYFDGGFLKRRSFNQALTLLLECVQQLGNFASLHDKELRLPFQIANGKIGDLSICLGDKEQWTKAFKFMLTHLKWLIVWIERNFGNP